MYCRLMIFGAVWRADIASDDAVMARRAAQTAEMVKMCIIVGGCSEKFTRNQMSKLEEWREV